MRAPKKPHPADVHAAAQVARAVSWAAHFRKGPAEKYIVACATLAEAREACVRLNEAHGAGGRRAILYAITPEGVAWPVSD
jgi:hypothetical protein